MVAALRGLTWCRMARLFAANSRAFAVLFVLAAFAILIARTYV